MKFIRYQTKMASAEQNAALVRAVLRQLHAAAPSDVRYGVLQLPDAGFVHLVEQAEGGPLVQLAAFKAFAAGVGDISLYKPRPAIATILGNYRLFAHAGAGEK